MNENVEKKLRSSMSSGSTTEEPVPKGVHSGGWLRQGLLGEYLLILLMAHSVMTAVAWVCSVTNLSLELVVVLASGWVATRCTGGFSGSPHIFVITVDMLGLTSATRWAEWVDVPTWLASGPFSQTVLQTILAAVLVIDLLELWQSRHSRIDHFHKSDGQRSQNDD